MEPDSARENDEKKQKFFESTNKKMLTEMRKHGAAKKIVKFLDPKNIAGLSTMDV